MHTRVVREKVRPTRRSGVARPRIDDAVDAMWTYRLTVIAAAAGSGKTTLLAQAANRAHAPVAWYRSEGADATEAALVRYLDVATSEAGLSLSSGWETVEDAAAALESAGPLLIVIDDFHLLAGTEAERACERLVEYVCGDVHIVLATRRTPGFDLSRLRIADMLLELGPEDLRFRAWEVEHLFRDHYGKPLPPDELAELTRRSGGWAAGLQLYHIATHEKSATDRRRILNCLASGPRVLREYLLANVLTELPEQLRAFLLDTCVLGVLTVSLCDTLADRNDAAHCLVELEQRHLCTCVDEAGTYRYHEVLRAYLEGALVERLGEAEVSLRYQRAGALLESHDAVADALVAYARAGDGAAVTRMLGTGGHALAASSSDWLDSLPRGLIQEDPWCLLATARRQALAGRLAESLDAYRAAEEREGTGPVADACRRERLAIGAFLQAAPPPAPTWIGVLRAAAAKDPLGVVDQARDLPAPMDHFVAGVAFWLAGHMVDARDELAVTLAADETNPVLEAAARLVEGHACVAISRHGSMESRRAVHRFEEAIAAADDAGALVLSQLGWRVLAARRRRTDEAAVTCAQSFEPETWPRALSILMEALAAIHGGQDPGDLTEGLADCFRTLGAGTLEAWAAAAHAFAATDVRTQRDRALTAETMARSVAVPGARALALFALAQAEPHRAIERMALAQEAADECGFMLPRLAEPRGARDATSSSEWRVRCFGHFEFVAAGRVLDLSVLRPRARTALRFLALHAGAFVHREALIEALWPGADEGTGTRQLHVAISCLRRLLEPGVERDGFQILVREGDAYSLRLPKGASIDLQEFEVKAEAARRHVEGLESSEAVESLRAALSLCTGELLVEEGPAEWLVEPRAHADSVAADSAFNLATILVNGGDAVGAIAAAEFGLRFDRYRDELWRALIDAHHTNGDALGEGRAREQYAARLKELGVGGAVNPSSGTPTR